MKIKIVEENDDVIRDTLAEINGDASRHTFKDWKDLEAVAWRSEARLRAAGVEAKHWHGVQVRAQSGGMNSSTLETERNLTTVNLIRKDNEWWLVGGFVLNQLLDAMPIMISVTPFIAKLIREHAMKEFWIRNEWDSAS